MSQLVRRRSVSPLSREEVKNETQSIEGYLSSFKEVFSPSSPFRSPSGFLRNAAGLSVQLFRSERKTMTTAQNEARKQKGQTVRQGEQEGGNQKWFSEVAQKNELSSAQDHKKELLPSSEGVNLVEERKVPESLPYSEAIKEQQRSAEEISKLLAENARLKELLSESAREKEELSSRIDGLEMRCESLVLTLVAFKNKIFHDSQSTSLLPNATSQLTRQLSSDNTRDVISPILRESDSTLKKSTHLNSLAKQHSKEQQSIPLLQSQQLESFEKILNLLRAECMAYFSERSRMKEISQSLLETYAPANVQRQVGEKISKLDGESNMRVDNIKNQLRLFQQKLVSAVP